MNSTGKFIATEDIKGGMMCEFDGAGHVRPVRAHLTFEQQAESVAKQFEMAACDGDPIQEVHRKIRYALTDLANLVRRLPSER